MPVVFVWVLGCRLPSAPSVDGSPNNASDSGDDVTDSGIASCVQASLWECPDALAQPCDAWWWVELDDNDNELDASDAARMVQEIVDANVPAGCLHGCKAANAEWSCVAALCAVDGVIIDYRREWIEEEWVGHKGHPMIHREEVVEAHFSTSTKEWTRLDFGSSLETGDDYELAAQAAWDGVIDASLPGNHAFYFTTRSWGSDHYSANAETWSSADCDIAVRHGGGLGSDHDYEIESPGSSLEIMQQHVGFDCETTGATLDGVTYEVGEEGWRIVGLDGDGDGFSVEGGDCDDDDPGRFPCNGC